MKKLLFLVILVMAICVFMPVVHAETGGNYVIVEVFDVWPGDLSSCSAINELELFDSSNEKISYSVSATDAFDTAQNGTPYYWNDTMWNKNGLNDIYSGYDIAHTTVVNYNSSSGAEKWTRFAIKLNSSNDIAKVKVWTGNVRVPKKITLYTATNYDYNLNIKGRDNTGLKLLAEINPVPSTTSVANEVSAIPQNSTVTLEVTSVDKARVGDEITANVVIHNATNICAEDLKLVYDTTKLEFVSAENADGMKIYKEDDLGNGIRRYITASLGKTNAANGDKILLTLKFKAKAIGEAKIDITNGRIADNVTLEKDIEEKDCGEKTILIEAGDVNRTGEFTLLDLGIDAWYYGDAVSNTDNTKYDTDVVANGIIDDADLEEIVKQMLNNKNYPISTMNSI